MQVKDFEKKLKEISPLLEVVPNPNRPGLSNIKYDGRDVCPIPSDIIKEEPDDGYRYTFPNGMSAPHTYTVQALARVHRLLELLEDPEFKDTFYGTD